MVSAVAAVVALLFSGFSLYLSHRSLRWERDSAGSARRSADAAERAADASEKANEISELHPLDSDGETAAPQTSDPDSTSRDVAFVAEHPSKDRWVLRNIGSETAHRVTVQDLPSGVITRQLPKGSTIPPRAGADMLILGTWQHPAPNEIRVTWEGQSDPVTVALSN